jgi:hypothetical protein
MNNRFEVKRPEAIAGVGKEPKDTKGFCFSKEKF